MKLQSMNPLRIRSYLSIAMAVFSILCGAAQADESCNHILNEELQIMPSGRNDDVMPYLEKAAVELFGQNGIAKKLGIDLPKHTLEFIPPSEFSMLATLGRHATPHWHDGAMLATQAAQSAGVLEFVTPGCPTCRSFYSDTTSKENQVSIMMHVVGHNDFAANSVWNKIRPSDPIADSIRLYELMVALYRDYDHDDVSQWYQYLLSLENAQDLARGTFDDPTTLGPKVHGSLQDRTLKRVVHAQDLPSYESIAHPRTPTPSVLQAIVANLPAGTPKWKIEMAQLFEKINRVYGYYVSNKIMNEGWATLMQEILAHYYSALDTNYAFEHADLLTGVAYQKLSNPYWMGRECWRNIRARFLKQPEIRGLPRLEQDRAFVKKAHGMMAWMNDYDFVREGIDEQWVFDHGLYLDRDAKPEEWDHSLPRPDPKSGVKNPTQKIVVSNLWSDVRDHLATKLADRTSSYPRILLKNFNYLGEGGVLLEHEVAHNLPLKLSLASQTLYVLSQIMHRPFTLKTFTYISKVGTEPDWEAAIGGIIRRHFMPSPGGGGWGGGGPWGWFPPPILERNAITIEVEPSGKVTIKVLEKAKEGQANDQYKFNEELTKEMQASVDAYKLDISVNVNDDLILRDVLTMAPSLSHKVADHAVQSSIGLLSHSPTSADALSEYYHLVQKRLEGVFKKILDGKTTPVTSGSKVTVKALPHIPEFKFDHQLANKVKKQRLTRLEKAPHPRSIPRVQLTLPPQANGEVGLGSGRKGGREPGDHYWGEKEKPGSGEDGEEGEEPGEPGDDPGGDDKSVEPGSPENIDIPLDLFGEVLSQELELPNLKPKVGHSEKEDWVRVGGMRRPYGNVLYERMINAALVHGQNSFRRRGKNPALINRLRLINEGFKFIQPSDYVVSSSDPTPIPDVNAVLVICLDMTGSMGAFEGLPIKRAKELVWNLKVFLRKKYKNLVIRYVGMDDSAREFKEEDFFKSFRGGGVDYAVGFNLSREILEEYPEAAWDRFSVSIGDAQDGGSPESVKALHDLVDLTQYSTFVRTDSQGNYDYFMKAVKSLGSENEFFNWAELTKDKESSMAALYKLFGKNRSKE